MKSRALLIGVLHVKFHGNFPLLQRIWSGDMNVANEVYVLLPIYFRSSLMDKSISSKGICWIPSLLILFIPRNPFAASNGDWLLRDNRGTELMCDARRVQSSCVRPAKEEPFSILSESGNSVPLSVRITSKSLENSKSPNNFFKCIKTSVTYWERLYGSR